MPTRTISFDGVRTCSDLAAELGVPVATLNMVSLGTASCKRNSCPFPLVLGNRGFCLVCSQSWFPREFNTKGLPATNRRGYGLYGPQFLPKREGNNPPSCCCASPLCEKLGYSHSGMFRFPTDPIKCAEAARVLGIQSEDRKRVLENPRNFKIAPWHYSSRHRQKDTNGKWRLRKGASFRDDDGKLFSFPPPNANIQHFIDEETLSFGFSRGGFDDSLPSWVRVMARLQQSATLDDSQYQSAGTQNQSAARVEPPPDRRNNIALRRNNITPPRREITPTRWAPKRRGNPESEEIAELTEQKRILEAQLHSALGHIDGLRATVELKNQEFLQVRIERDNLKEECRRLNDVLDEVNTQQYHLLFDDLRPSGALASFVKDFTFFPDFECNDAFLDLINFADGREPGDGLCENMARYRRVSIDNRREFQENNVLAGNRDSGSGGDGDDGMSISSDAGTGLEDVIVDAKTSSIRRGRKRKLHWKTEWLVYCFYARCNMSMKRISAFFGIGATLVHDIVYAWANLLCITLEKFFPTPTRSQMLRAYPKSIIKKFGHANIFLMLDATEIAAEVASMKTVNAILYSAYKHNSTMKWLAGCCPIGSMWNESIGIGHGGSISDPIATAVSQILDAIPFGMAVEVDKGFLIENECALLGIVSIRPMKMLDRQKQQSKPDVGLTQKVGKSRIVIEQCNGQMKEATNFFDSKIKIQQLGLADRIFRSSFLLQNFKLPFIQERDERDDRAKVGRPCKAEVQWYGSTDDGLVDVRPEVELWGIESEIVRWHELRNMDEHLELTNTDISEMVFEEDWPSKLQKLHLEKIQSQIS